MKFTLKPLTHLELGEIVVRDDLFAISAAEAPFSSLPEGAAPGLSANHAKLFRQQGTLHVVDLGSRGGTTVNGRAVHRRAVPLAAGDEVCFAGTLCFRLEIGEERVAESDQGPLTLVLVPAHGETPLEPIAVDHFPFLIGKDVGVFAGYKARFPEETRYISRRHALIFRRQDGLYVEDLGSTNGTFLGAERVKAAARLEDRASIAFGGNFFSYRIELESVVAEALSQEPGTIFVSAADSFLDAFCPEAEGAGDVGDAAGAEQGGHGALEASRSAGKPRRRGPLARLRILLTEVKAAFADNGPKRRHRRWLWLGFAGGLMAIAVALGFYLKGSPERAIRELMTEGRYAESAAMASRYLQADPGNERVGLLGTESLVKRVVPPWMSKLERGDFQAADDVLASAARLSKFNDDARSMLGLIEWAGRLEQFVAERGGAHAPIVVFRDEAVITELVEWWEEDSHAHRNRLTRLIDYVPEFRPMGVRVASHLMSLQNQKSTYVNAIAELARSVRKDLAAGRAGAAERTLQAFQSQYPRVGGMDRVSKDLQRWKAIQAAIERHELDVALRLSRQGQFATPLFRQAAQAQIAEKLPPPELAAEYEKAQRAWSQGEWDQAFELLQRLADRPWGEVAQQRLQRYRRVLNDYRLLGQAKGSAAYGQKLLAFYNRLEPGGDARLRHALADDYQSFRAQALQQAKQQFQQASADWGRYQARGGIDGLLRLEDAVSEAYRGQAGLLSRALAHASDMMNTYELLQKPAPAPVRGLYEKLFAEVKRQRQWLKDMRIVMDASLLKAKLELLPGPPESMSHER